MKTLNDIKLSGKRAVVRVDFDVPVKDTTVEDATRIEKCIPTLKFLLEKQFNLFLISHLGRPEGRDEKFSLSLVKPLLEKLLGEEVALQEDLETKTEDKIVLLENLRFWKEEENNDASFAQKLASFGDLYVNECFSVAHRAHASVSTLPKLLPAYAGLELAREIEELEKIFKNPKHPLVAILGGAKIETKLPAITNLAKVADKVLVGGRLMFEVQKDTLPENVVVASDDIDTKDIGELSVKTFKDIIDQAQMIVWNGPLGMYEEEKYRNGTLKIAEIVGASSAYKIVGGGDTLSALETVKMLAKMDFVSVGGGAMLEFLGGKRLPALESLGYYND